MKFTFCHICGSSSGAIMRRMLKEAAYAGPCSHLPSLFILHRMLHLCVALRILIKTTPLKAMQQVNKASHY
jgi:hypothetical protein